ncbi:MAG: alpha/beta hydrolase [Sedimentitalea sp.]
MPMIRINAVHDQPFGHSCARSLAQVLSEQGHATGPALIMIHGCKYRPQDPKRCPHNSIMALHPVDHPNDTPSWPRRLGFGSGFDSEGLGIAFGWNATGALWQAQARATQAGRALANTICALHMACPGRAVHVLAHSMGLEVVLEALHHLEPGMIGRIISMTGASYQSRVLASLATPAGRAAEFVNVTSRENDLFDFLFERLFAPPVKGDRAIGQGLSAPNVVTLQLDCTDTLAHLRHLGLPIAAPERRICHWSSYRRPGLLELYKQILRHPKRWPLSMLRVGLPLDPAPRWSRLMPRAAMMLPFGTKTG